MQVLFVCVANSGRSLVRERLLPPAAGGRHRARSPRWKPGRSAHPQVLDALAEVGIDASDHLPHMLDQETVDWADVIVATCDDACPVVPGKRYLLESATELPNFTAIGQPFTAQFNTVTNEFIIQQTGQFFRIQEVP